MQLMEKGDAENQTDFTEFILLAFGDLPELQILLFLVFLVIYIVTMAGNILIIALLVTDQHLHTPMYFFLGNLSCLETCYTSILLPRMLASFLTGDRTISVVGCMTQFFVLCFLATTECYLLAAMSYDRYLAICKPLHYGTCMNGKLCLQLAAGCWINGFLPSIIMMCFMSQLIFCGPNEMDHFFCDLTPILKLSCSDTSQIMLVLYIFSFLDVVSPFLLTMTSYVCIVSTILRISSTIGRQRAFSTCSSHLIVLTLFYGTVMIVYMLPKSSNLRALNKVFSVCYTVLTPLTNPLVYSLRNREVKAALRKAVRKCLAFTKNSD
ncbi:olfactory receptor 10A7-like [Mauremys reevesii]|uniref:olfactory receptor 10A7-like n=1 Tax=Mauremys reevesii TaxID=260615 RepID=UPI00193F53C7|nr:olfactory receptor 10A7-like [Mauremys reevesii]